MVSTHTLLDRLLAVIMRVGAEADDSEYACLQKTLLVGASLMFILAGLLLGSIYVALTGTGRIH
jgi:hypothetical protein